MDEGAFSVDFAAAYTVMAILFICIFFTATNAISARYTAGYADELRPLAVQVGDELLKTPGSPDWYTDPSNSRNATSLGLSEGGPGILSTYKIEGLYFYNASGLKEALGLSDKGEEYGLRIEIRSLDGTISRTAGYPLPPDTKDVFKSQRIATIKDQDDIYRDANVIIYMWRKDVGAGA